MSTNGSPFGVRVLHHGSHTVVRVEGELDLATAPQLRSRLGNLIADADGPILLDLDGLTYVDSTGLCAVLTANSELRRHGRELRVIKASVPVRRLFELCGITDLISGDPRAEDEGALSA
jgi:anti-sigma B factor antagonist